MLASFSHLSSENQEQNTAERFLKACSFARKGASFKSCGQEGVVANRLFTLKRRQAFYTSIIVKMPPVPLKNQQDPRVSCSYKAAYGIFSLRILCPCSVIQALRGNCSHGSRAQQQLSTLAKLGIIYPMLVLQTCRIQELWRHRSFR